MKKLYIFCIVSVAVMLTSCTSYTRMSQYPKMYDEKPVTLLVLPPINSTTHVEAKDLLYTSISVPLIEAGYYVISPYLAMDILKQESAYDAELFVEQDVNIFAKYFGADAVIFSEIKTWQKVGVGIQTQIHYFVKSTTTNEIIFDRECDLFLNLTQSSGGNSLASSIIDAVSTVVSTALTDHIVAARLCNYYIFSDIPRGKYDAMYQKDGDSPANTKNISATVRP